nr:hypothetical protein [Tanacetum cinerariifolium]
MDYALWEVIKNGATFPKTQVVEGVTTVMPITLVKKGSEKLASQLELLGEKLSQEDVNKKLLRSLSSEWNIHVVVWRNKADLDTMSMYDLYNNLKVYEPEVTGMSSTNSNTQNIAFVSSTNSRTNEAVNIGQAVNTTNEVSTLALKDGFKMAIGHVDYEGQKVLKKTRRKLIVNGNETLGFDMFKVECYNCHKKEHFARECRAPRNQDNKHKESTRKSVPIETPTSTALVSRDGLDGYDWSDQT